MNIRINVEFKMDEQEVELEDAELVKEALRNGVKRKLSDFIDEDINVLTQDGRLRTARLISISYKFIGKKAHVL